MFKAAIRLKPVSAFLDFWYVTMDGDVDDFDPEAKDLRRRTWQEVRIETDPDTVLFIVTDVDASKGFRSFMYALQLRWLYRVLKKRVRMRRFIRVRNCIRRRMMGSLERLPWTSVPTGGTNVDTSPRPPAQP